MFEDIIGLIFPIRIGCVSAEVALAMDAALEAGRSMVVNGFVSSGECGVLPEPVLFQATEVLNGEGDMLTIAGTVNTSSGEVPFFTHMGPDVAESIIERQSL